MLNPIFIEARDLPDAWFQCVFSILENGKVFTIDKGSFEGQKRLEFDYITIHIKYPNTRPLIPKIASHFGIPDPVTDEYIDDYLPYLMTGEVKPGESYTYGQRMCKFPITEKQKDNITIDKDIWKNDKIVFEENGQLYLNQIELLIWTYKNKGFRNNQMVLQIAKPDDMLLLDPPCCRQLDARIQDGKLHFYIYFRSWDCFNGLPANLAGIQLMKEYIVDEIGVEDGEIIASSKGLHLYDYVFDIAKVLRMKEDIELKKGKN